MSRSRVLACGLAALLVGSLSVEPVSAWADGKDKMPSESPFAHIEPETLARMLTQAPLVSSAEQVYKVIDEGTALGFSGIVLEDDHVVLWWKGDLPPDVASVVQSQENVVVAEAAYSRRELTL